MTPGTRPDARSFRATPLPLSVRGVAFSDAVAISFFLPCSCFRLRSYVGARFYSQEAASSLPYARQRFSAIPNEVRNLKLTLQIPRYARDDLIRPRAPAPQRAS